MILNNKLKNDNAFKLTLVELNLKLYFKSTNRKVLCGPGPRAKYFERPFFCRSINYKGV